MVHINLYRQMLRDICNKEIAEIGREKRIYWNRNSCAVNYDDMCFGVLPRARTKQHLVILEALYILFYKLCASKIQSTP